MKKIIYILFLFLCLPTYSQKECFINLQGDSICLNKNYYLITLSSISCHQCYKELNDFLTEKKYFTNNNIYIICLDEKENILTATVRKSLFYLAQEYFPSISKEHILFAFSHNSEALILNYRIDVKMSPFVFEVASHINKCHYDTFIDKAKRPYE